MVYNFSTKTTKTHQWRISSKCKRLTSIYNNRIKHTGYIANKTLNYSSKYFDFSAQIKEEKKEEPENSEVTQLGDVLDSLSLSENRTCLCTDERMMLHYNLTSP